MTREWVSCKFWVAVIVAVIQPAGFAEAALCPNRVATLTKIPGKSEAIFSSQRVEIRQCPIGTSDQADPPLSTGVIQLAAWARGAGKPSLVLDTLEVGLYQVAMIEGVYAFELMGGLASQMVVIQFVDGKPRVAMNETSKFPFSLEVAKDKLSVAYTTSEGVHQTRSFGSADSGDRR